MKTSTAVKGAIICGAIWLIGLCMGCKKEEAQPAQECATCSTETITTTFHGGSASTEETTYVATQRCDNLQMYNGLTSTDTTYNSWDGSPQVAHWSHTTCQ